MNKKIRYLKINKDNPEEFLMSVPYSFYKAHNYPALPDTYDPSLKMVTIRMNYQEILKLKEYVEHFSFLTVIDLHKAFNTEYMQERRRKMNKNK